jgi:hypothetical protein
MNTVPPTYFLFFDIEKGKSLYGFILRKKN